MIDNIPPSAKEHWDILYIIVVVLAGILYAWGMRTLNRVEKKQDEFIATQTKCQLELPEKYVNWHVLTGPEGLLTEIKKDRKEKWNEFDRHKHDPNSGVVVKSSKC